MIAEHIGYSQLDVGVFDQRIEMVRQEIAFERVTFGQAYPEGDSIRVRYLLDDIRVLEKQRAEILARIQQRTNS